MTDVHLQVEVTNYRHQTVLLLVEAKDVLLEVEAELELVATLLDIQHILSLVEEVVTVEHALNPLVEDFLLILGQTALE